MTITAAIIDDEDLALRNLERLLTKFDNISLVGQFTDPLAGVAKCAQIKPNVLFLDIEMPVINGFEVAAQLIDLSPDTRIVFVTAFDDHAVKAFELNSIDYLLKPVTEERMAKTINRIEALLYTKQKNIDCNGIENVIVRSKTKMHKVLIMDNERLMVINPQEIYFFSSENNIVKIFTADKEYISKDPLSLWECKMSDFDFYRCHKSFLVNLQKISEIRTMFNNTYLLKLQDYRGEIPVSRRYANGLKSLIGI